MSTSPAVLPRPHRVTRPEEFRRVLRGGRKAGRKRLVLHVLTGPRSDGDGGTRSRAGLVVGRSVGPAVVRHRISRRLRHLLADRLDALPPGTDLVVRAQGPAASASSDELGADLDAALARLGLPAGGRCAQSSTSEGLKR